MEADFLAGAIRLFFLGEAETLEIMRTAQKMERGRLHAPRHGPDSSQQ